MFTPPCRAARALHGSPHPSGSFSPALAGLFFLRQERPECPADCLDGPQALERDKPPGLGAAGPRPCGDAGRGSRWASRLRWLKPGKRPGRLSRPGLPRPVWARGGRITLSYGTDWTPDPTVKLSVTGFYEFFRNELVAQSPSASSNLIPRCARSGSRSGGPEKKRGSSPLPSRRRVQMHWRTALNCRS